MHRVVMMTCNDFLTIDDTDLTCLTENQPKNTENEEKRGFKYQNRRFLHKKSVQGHFDDSFARYFNQKGFVAIFI